MTAVRQLAFRRHDDTLLHEFSYSLGGVYAVAAVAAAALLIR